MKPETKFWKDAEKNFKLPEPYVITFTNEKYNYSDKETYRQMNIVGGDFTLRITFGYKSTLDIDGNYKSRYLGATGCSSWKYHDLEDGPFTTEILLGWMKEAIEHEKEASTWTPLTFNGHTWRCSPESLQEKIKDLKTKGCISLMPKGFGTGVYVYIRKRSRYARSLQEKQTLKLLQQPSLWIEEQEMD